MKTRHAFDRVFDTQIVFRHLLQAMANPGAAEDIAGPASRLDESDTAMLAVAATLLDNEVSFHIYGGGGDNLRDFTGARPAAMSEADYLFIYEPIDQAAVEAIFRAIKPGTLEGPDSSCTLIVKLPTDDDTVDIAGPGIPGLRSAAIGSYGENFLRQRQGAGYLYPCGVDIIFVGGNDSVICVPRLCKIGEEK